MNTSTLLKKRFLMIKILFFLMLTNSFYPVYVFSQDDNLQRVMKQQDTQKQIDETLKLQKTQKEVQDSLKISDMEKQRKQTQELLDIAKAMELVIKSDKEIYKVGEPINIELSFRPRFKRTHYLNTLGIETDKMVWYISGPSGKKDKIAPQEVSREDENGHLKPAKEDFILIKEDKPFQTKINLTNYGYSFPSTGEYIVFCRYTNYELGKELGITAWAGTIKSNIIQIKLE
jgi:hypothetical protein